MEKYLQILSDNIKTLAKELQLSQTDFLEECDVSRSFISNMKRSMPTIDKILSISKYTNKSLDYLLGLSDVRKIITSENLEKNIPPEDKHILDQYRNLTPNNKSIVDYIFGMEEEVVEPTKIYYFPVYQQDVAAGSGQLGFDQKHEMEEFSEIDMPKKISYGIKIKGNSMETDDENNIPDGSTVLVTTELDYDELVGEAVVVNINGNLVCKEYNIAEDGHLWLKSRNRNKANEDRNIYDLDGVKIIGRVVKVIGL